MSRGEWAIARRAGVPNDRITLEGIGKTDADLRAAIRATAAGSVPLAWVALELADEAAVVTRMARRAGLGRGGRPALDVLVRLNPDVTPETVPGLAVGEGTSKFGLTETEATGLVEWLTTHAGEAVRPRGIHLHVGSQLRAVDAWRDAVRRGLAVVGLLRGGLPAFDTLDVGGGFPVLPLDEPAPGPERFAREIPDLLEGVPEDRRPRRLAIEPGRALVARSGWLVASVLHVRDRGGPQVVIDAGMTELIRPALYGARHPIVALTSLGRVIEAGDDDATTATDADTRRGTHLRVDRRARPPRPARRSGEATSWRSATRARMAPRWPRPTTDGRTRRRSWSSRTVDSVSRAARGPDGRVRMMPMDRLRGPLALLAALAWLLVVAGGPVAAASPAPAPPAGPPFPEPVVDQAVYDYAGLFSEGAIGKAEATIDAIEARTGSEVVVYTQNSGEYPTTDETEAKARALMDQWGIGRAGINDGLVIFFDMQPNLEHGQVQLYAGPGFEAAYLSNEERQAIFENDMLPYLESADFDGALGVALEKVDAAATPDHAAALQRSRQINAVVGLVGAPIIFLGLSGWALFHWRRFGKDPVYLDDPSVLMPAPPPDLTAASGAMIMDGSTSRRALTTAMLDLASRGLIAFREDGGGILGLGGHKVGIDASPAKGDAEVEAQRRLNARRPIGPAEQLALKRLETLGAGEDGAFITPDDLPKFGSEVSAFDAALEKHVVDRGWFGEKPSKVVARWIGRGVACHGGRGHRHHRRAQHPVLGLDPPRRGGHRGRHRDHRRRPGDAGGDDARGDDPGDAGRLPADAPEDDGPGALDAAGRRPRPDSPGSTRPTRPSCGAPRSVSRATSRASCRAASRTSRPGATSSGIVPYFPFWYQTSSGTPFLGSRVGWQRLEPLLRLGDPRRRRDDVGARDDRQLAGLVGGGGGGGGFGGGGRAAAAAAPAAGSRAAGSGPEHLPAGFEPLDGRGPDAAATANPPRSSGIAASRARTPSGASCRSRSPRSRASATRAFDAALSRNAAVSATRAPSPSKANPSTAARISVAEPAALERLAEPRAGVHRPVDRECLGVDRLRADRVAVAARRSRLSDHLVRRPLAAHRPVVLHEAALEGRTRDRRPGDPERHLVGRVDPGPRERHQIGRGRRRSAGAGRAVRCAAGDRTAATRRSSVVRAPMGGRRYTPRMGAVETMEDFFEKLNGGDREAAVALMDEKTEMRVHVGDSVQTLRGVERVGGWFLRGDTGLRMIPGEIRDTGQHLGGGPARRPARSAEPAHRRDVPRRGRQDHRDQHRAALGERAASRATRPATALGRRRRRVTERSTPRRTRGGVGMMIWSPMAILSGFVIVSLLAASRSSRVTLNFFATFSRLSPCLIM